MSVPAVSLANTDPTPNMTESWGQCFANAKRAVDTLTLHLRALDRAQAQLAERGMTVSVDLGPIGNAAAAARRDLEKRRDQPTFKMPDAAGRGNDGFAT